MLNYSYHMPTKIKWGPEAVLKNANLLQQYGRKVAIITGTTSAAKSGALSDIMGALTANGQVFQVFSGVLTDPSIENVIEMATNVKRYAPDFLVAIGGGSVIDATKVIAILLTGGIKEETIWQPISQTPVAVVAIPTTAGTGSEVTPYAVLTDNNLETKRSVVSELIYPVLSFLDPRYTESMSYELTISTATDALSHLLEGYFANRANNMSNEFAISGLKLWSECICGLTTENITKRQRECLLAASLLGGLTIAKTGTTLVHALGYSLTYYYHMPHGKANGLLLGAYLEYMQKTSPTKTIKVLEALGLTSVEEFSTVFAGLFTTKLNLSTREIAGFVEKAIKTNNIANTPGDVTAFVLADILERSLG